MVTSTLHLTRFKTVLVVEASILCSEIEFVVKLSLSGGRKESLLVVSFRIEGL